MISKQILSVLAATIGFASAQNGCTAEKFTINSAADLSKFSSCRTLKGNVEIGSQTDTTIDFGSIQSVDGDVKLTNNTDILILKGDFLSSITGEFHLEKLNNLNTLGFPALKSVGKINWVTLRAIDQLSFTAGITKATSAVISDTFLSSLDGINFQTVETMDINNNNRLVKWSSQITNITKSLNIDANGLNLQVSLPNLQRAGLMTISNVSSFDVPSLAQVDVDLKFFSNFFTSFSAPNLTSTKTGDISFVSNPQLTNITMPRLTSIGGGFLIANNTGLHTVNGFSQLKSVGGAIKFRGSFTDVSLPALNDVKGAFDAASTEDLKSSCDTFNKMAPGQGGQIQGEYSCNGGVENANSDTSSTTGGTTGKGNSAAGIAVNMAGVLGLTVVGLVFQAML